MTQPSSHDSPLDHIATAAKALHGAIAEAVDRHGQAARDHLVSIPKQAEAVIASVKGLVDIRTEITKKHLNELVRDLEATEQHIAESLRSDGQAFHTAVRQALDASKSAITKISEIVTARRSAISSERNKHEG